MFFIIRIISLHLLVFSSTCIIAQSTNDTEEVKYRKQVEDLNHKAAKTKEIKEMHAEQEKQEKKSNNNTESKPDSVIRIVPEENKSAKPFKNIYYHI
jgi:hypothetical protein